MLGASNVQREFDRRARSERGADLQDERSVVDGGVTRVDVLVVATAVDDDNTGRISCQRCMNPPDFGRIQRIGDVVAKRYGELDGVARIEVSVAAALLEFDCTQVQRGRLELVILRGETTEGDVRDGRVCR